MSLILEGEKTKIIEYAQAKLDSDYKKEPIKVVATICEAVIYGAQSLKWLLDAGIEDQEINDSVP